MKLPKVFAYILESNTRIIPILGILVLALALPITLNLIEYNQDTRQQAAPPVSVQQQDGTGIPNSSCQDLGLECVDGSNWDEQTCFGVDVGGAYACSAANQVCCLKKDVTLENQTCVGPGKSCEYNSITSCESAAGIGNCELDTVNRCFNRNLCMTIASSSTPQSCPGQCHASESVCESNNGGKDCSVDSAYTCSQSGTTCFAVGAFPPLGAPCQDGSGNYSCGFGTPDTQCPVCSTVASCTSNNYSIASCSTGSACTSDSDCAGLPSSCPAGTTGSVSCIQNICQTVNCQ